MNLREAGNVAWHARFNGLDQLTPEHILGAFAVLEQLVEAELKRRLEPPKRRAAKKKVRKK